MTLVMKPVSAQDRIEAGPGFYSPVVPEAGFGAAYKAAFVEENSIAQWKSDLEFKVEEEALDGYDPYQDIPEDLQDINPDTWRGISSPSQMQGRIGEIRAERNRRAIASTNGWGNFLGAMSGYLLSPETVPELLLTQGRSGLVGMARVGAGALAGTAVHELAMHSQSYNRSYQESMVNIGLATFAGAGLGYAFGRSTEKAFVRDLTKDLREAVQPQALVSVDPNAQSIGAAALASEGESIINKPWLKWGFLAPVRPLAHATNAEVSYWFNKLVSHSYTPAKTLEGKAKDIALETRVGRELGVIANNTNKALTSGYKAWAQEQGMGLTQRLRPKNWHEFQRELHLAMVSGDSHTSQAVAQTAKAMRTDYDKVFSIAAESRKMYPDADDFLSLEEYVTKFADSYAPRRYNKRKIQQDEIAFKEELHAGFKREREEAAFKQAQTKLQEQIKKSRAEETPKALKKADKLQQRLDDLIDRRAAATKGSKNAILLTDKIRKLKGQITRLKAQADQAELQAIESETKLNALTQDQFRITDQEILSEIQADVNASFDRIVNSYDLDVFMPVTTKTSGNPFKERKIPLRDEDMIARGWLDSDIHAMTTSYMNRVLKPARMLMETGDTDMKSVLKRIDESYEAMKDAAIKSGADKKTLDKLNAELKASRDAMSAWRDRWYGRSSISTSRKAEAVNDVLRTMRNLNVARLMGMVTPISVGDVFRTNMTTIFAPELGVKGPGLLKALKSARASRKLYKDVGIAHEVSSYVRTGKIMDDSGVLDGTSRAVHLSSAASKGLMKATMLGQWTDWAKEVAAAYTQNDLLQKMRGFSKLSPRSKAQLAQMGIDEKWAKRLDAEFGAMRGKPQDQQSIVTLGKETHGYEGKAYVLQWDNFTDQELANHLKDVLFTQSERNIVTPGAGEIPRLVANEEVNKTIFQFQSFLFGAAHSVTVNLGMRLRMRDPKALLIMTNMIAGGMLATALRGAAYGRWDEMEQWTAQDWVLNGIDYSSITPLFMMGFNHANLFTGNALVNSLGATSMSRYAHRPLGSFFGPSVGLAEDAFVAAQSIIGIPMGENLTPGDIRRMRRLLPWNNLAYIAAGVNELQTQIEEGL